jgi:hypothetical protein
MPVVVVVVVVVVEEEEEEEEDSPCNCMIFTKYQNQHFVQYSFFLFVVRSATRFGQIYWPFSYAAMFLKMELYHLVTTFVVFTVI